MKFSPVMPRGAHWADLAQSEAQLLEKFGIPAAAYAYDSKRNYPRYNERKGHTAIILLSLSFEGRAIAKKRIVLYAAPGRLVSVGASDLMDWFEQECAAEQGMRKAGVEEAFYQVLYEIVKRNSMLLPQLEEGVNRLEATVAGEKSGLDLRSLFLLKRELIQISRVLWRERDIVHEFRNNHLQYMRPGRAQQSGLEDLFNALLFDMNSVDTMREVLSDALDIHHTIVSNSINKSIERLTVVTVWLAILGTISAFPNTIATIFGIPYLPLKADVAVFEFGGIRIFPWELVVILLSAFTVVPALLLIVWWKRNMQLKN